MNRYDSLGQLLSGLRAERRISQERAAKAADSSKRTYRRWEKNESCPKPKNLLKISQQLRVPFEVLLRLREGFPTLYDLRTHRFACCPFDADFVNRNVLQGELFDTEEAGRLEAVQAEANLGEVLRWRREVFPRSLLVRHEVVASAVEALPAFNFLLRDPVGNYSGHLLMLPLRRESYEALLREELKESDLEIAHLAGAVGTEAEVFLHIYSLFATCSTYAYTIVRRMVAVLHQNPRQSSESTVLSTYVTTADGVELATKLELAFAWEEQQADARAATQVPGRFYHKHLRELEWVQTYKKNVARPRPR